MDMLNLTMRILNAGQGLMFELAQDEIECGMGVHGEAGYERIKLRTASELVMLMLKRICEVLSLSTNDSVAVIINNFGALSQLEQGIIVYEVVNQLRKYLFTVFSSFYIYMNINHNMSRLYSIINQSYIDFFHLQEKIYINYINLRIFQSPYRLFIESLDIY